MIPKMLANKVVTKPIKIVTTIKTAKVAACSPNAAKNFPAISIDIGPKSPLT